MNWYCIHTKPHRELPAKEQLSERLGHEVFYPQLRRRRRIRRVARIVTEPLFPQYLFCRFDLANSFRAVRYAHDVLDILRAGEEPAVVGEDLIADLKTFTDRHGSIIHQPAPLSPGERVEICEGPMRGLEAVILDAPAETDRVAILLSILGCGARLTISRFELARAG